MANISVQLLKYSPVVVLAVAAASLATIVVLYSDTLLDTEVFVLAAVLVGLPAVIIAAFLRAVAAGRRPSLIGILIVGAIMSYLVFGIVVYWLFYTISAPHDEETAFKAGFVGALLIHHGLTLTSSALLAKLLKVRIMLLVAVAGLAMLLLAVPVLSILALVNDCMGVSFPWDGGCPD